MLQTKKHGESMRTRGLREDSEQRTMPSANVTEGYPCSKGLPRGATCRWWWTKCHRSRGPTDCVRGKCQCKEGFCADGAGKCVALPDPTPHPTPHPTPSPTPSPTPHPTPSPTPSPTPAPTPSPTPSPTACDVPGIKASGQYCSTYKYVSACIRWTGEICSVEKCAELVRQQCPQCLYFSYRKSTGACHVGSGADETCSTWKTEPLPWNGAVQDTEHASNVYDAACHQASLL